MTPPSLQQDRITFLLNDELGLDAARIAMLKPGAWSSAYAFASGGHEFVVRFSEHHDDFHCDVHAMRFAGPGIPIPRVTHRGTWDGVYFAISERVMGEFFDDLSADGLKRTVPSLLTTLDGLRSADVSDSQGYGGWDPAGNGTAGSWRDFLWVSLQDSPDYRGGIWRPALERSPTGADAFDRDIRVLERRLDDLPNIRHVIHSDLLNFNMFAENHQVSGVIDWGCAIYGDFLYELAWFGFWWPWYPQWSGIGIVDVALRHYDALGVDLHLAPERLPVYKLHISLSHQAYHASIGNWPELEKVTRLTTLIADELR
jgi:hygromycin-B 4-O-kinase